LASTESLCDGTSEETDGSSSENENIGGMRHLSDLVHSVDSDRHWFNLSTWERVSQLVRGIRRSQMKTNESSFFKTHVLG